MAANNQYILFGFFGLDVADETQAQLAIYNISTGTWTSPVSLFNDEYDFTASNSTETIETDIQITLHQGKFIITWIRNRVVVSLHKFHSLYI